MEEIGSKALIRSGTARSGERALKPEEGNRMAAENPKVFRQRPQVTMTAKLAAGERAALEQWSSMVPTLHFLDINVVSVIKRPDVSPDDNPRKATLLKTLRGLDQPNHAFSYLLALMEKVSDLRGTASETELESQVLRDLSALTAFFEKARVIESDKFVIDYLRQLRRVPPEIERPRYLEFLEAVNTQFNFRDPVAPAVRLREAEALLAVADRLSITRHHPTVLLTIACIYGSRAAKRLMKFKADPTRFNADNALADIMAIVRLAQFKLQIEQHGGYGRAKLITDDDGLGGVLDCFTPVSVSITDTYAGADTAFEFRVDMWRLLFAHAADGGDEADESRIAMQLEECERVFRLLSAAPGESP